MKLDVRLLKKILNTIQEKDSHYVSVIEILEDVQPDYEYIEKEDFKDLFYGHLLLLKDSEVIEKVFGNGENLGLHYSMNKILQTSACFIRITSKGYDYIKLLNKNGVVEKIKNTTITEGLKLSEYVLIESVKNSICNLL